MNPIKTVLVTGGAGYVGAILVPKLLHKGYKIKVLDLYTYGTDIFDCIKDKSGLEEIKGDICDTDLLEQSLRGCDAVIHLACISNDPTFELNPALSRKVNYDAFEPLVRISKQSDVHRFIYASTCSVYGVSDAENVTEDHPLLPTNIRDCVNPCSGNISLPNLPLSRSGQPRFAGIPRGRDLI